MGSNQPTNEIVSQLEYVEMVIKESMRVYPTVVSTNPRICDADTWVDDVYIPTGSYVFGCVYAALQNPEYWPDPKKFDPNRFSPENSAQRHPYAYCPFILGKRHCIGLTFAMMEMKVVLAMILRKFNVHVLEEATTSMNTLVGSFPTLRLKLEKRNI